MHLQSMTFPSLCYLGQFSPFESPPPRFEKQTEQGENKTRFVLLGHNFNDMDSSIANTQVYFPLGIDVKIKWGGKKDLNPFRNFV